MKQIFIRFCGTVLAILNIPIFSAHGDYGLCEQTITTYCENADDVLYFLEYKDLPENSASGTSGASGASSVSGASRASISRAAPITGINCTGMSCTEGCKYDAQNNYNGTPFPITAWDPVKYRYKKDGRIGFCTDSGIWMPYGLVKEFLPAASGYITGTDLGFRNKQQWPQYNEYDVIGTLPCITIDGDHGNDTFQYFGCPSGCYSDTITTNDRDGAYLCHTCPTGTGIYSSATYSAKSASLCAGPTCCSLSLKPTTDTKGTYIITNCQYEE